MRPEKVHIVADIQTKLKNSPFLLIADYSGMQVKHFEELRLRLARVDAEIHVIRNTFIKRAIKAWACHSSTALSPGRPPWSLAKATSAPLPKCSRLLLRNSNARRSKGAFWTTRS